MNIENSGSEELSEQTARRLLDILTPGSDLTSITVPPGSFSNFTYILEARLEDGGIYKVVVRRHNGFGNYDRGEKARRDSNVWVVKPASCSCASGIAASILPSVN